VVHVTGDIVGITWAENFGIPINGKFYLPRKDIAHLLMGVMMVGNLARFQTDECQLRVLARD
jgi:hypothetical protein